MTAGPVQWLQKQAQDNPLAPALSWAGDTLSYGAFLEQIEKAAATLHQDGTGRLILAQEGSALHLATLFFAAPLSGNVLMPLDPRMPEGQGRTLVDLAMSEQRFSVLPPDPAAVHLVIATSGTSGTPKGVMLTGANLAASALASRQRIELSPGDTWLACMPLFHIGGLSILTRCVEVGATVVLQSEFDVDAVLAAIEKDGVSHLSLVPTMLFRLLEALGDRPPPGVLKAVLVGGAALSSPLARRAREAGWPIAPTYGMSESASQCATLFPMPSDWQEGSVGQPLDGFEVALSCGRLKLRGPAMMAGYLNQKRRSGDGLHDGWFVTSDLAKIDGRGALTVLGRADDVLIAGGENIHPATVESVLSGCEGVDEIAVTGISDPEWGESLLAVYAGRASEQSVLEQAVKKLSGPYRPRRVIKVLALPRNRIGKLDRDALKERAKEKTTSL